MDRMPPPATMGTPRPPPRRSSMFSLRLPFVHRMGHPTLLGGPPRVLALDALHLLTGLLELGSVPHLLDSWPDVPFFLFDVVLERFLQLFDLLHPLLIGRI